LRLIHAQQQLNSKFARGGKQKIASFDDWKDLFYKWQKDIGFDVSLIKDYKFDAIYDEIVIILLFGLFPDFVYKG
jgi:hypothetical protein